MIKILSLTVLFIFGFCGNAFSQSKDNPRRFLLTTQQTDFRIGEDTKVKLTFENKTGKKINPDRDLAVRFSLQRTSVINADCGWNDCYAAWFEPTGKFVSVNGGTYELEVGLADLFWMDNLDSKIRITSETLRKKNFFKQILSGSFNLKAELHHILWKQTGSSPANTFESNSVLIMIETEKKQRK
jgi:hypothetical protein